MVVTSQQFHLSDTSFPISHSGRRHIVCQYLKDGMEGVLYDQFANNQPGSKFCQYLIRVQVTSQGGGTFVSPPQVLPIWTIFNAATFTHRGKQGQTTLQFGGKMQLNFLINFDALLARCRDFWSPIYDIFCGLSQFGLFPIVSWSFLKSELQSCGKSKRSGGGCFLQMARSGTGRRMRTAAGSFSPIV